MFSFLNTPKANLLLMKIANAHTFEQEFRQLSEEYGELTQALNKFVRYELNDNPVAFDFPSEGRKVEIAEEIADVIIVLQQLSIMLRCDVKVATQYNLKLEREIDRLCGTTWDKH